MPVSPEKKRTAAPKGRKNDAVAPRAGRERVIIEDVQPVVDAGRFPAKRVVGERVRVTAAVFADGHDEVACVVRYRKRGERRWNELRMRPRFNDEWEAHFTPTSMGAWEFTITGWIDHYGTWRHDLRKRLDAGQDVSVDLLIGAGIIGRAAGAARGEARREIERFAADLRNERLDVAERATMALSDPRVAVVIENDPRSHAVQTPHPLLVTVERPRALFSAWYEMFPRSASAEPGRHGTFADVEARLPYIQQMGFDILYLPPIHPVGVTNRKGRNNAPVAGPDDVGSPWAIGGPLADGSLGGHKSVHPGLGDLNDFDRLVAAAERRGIEIALDIAFQCSPDHPYVRDHPEWFRSRPDGTIQYAENPPKKYQDIYPFDFECEAWESLWDELLSVLRFWVERGVKIFRVDNPHTKSMPFWDWAIAELRSSHPEVILLSEAFTRPHRMYRLAKGGFSQSYTYFAWRPTPADLEQYVRELTQTEVVEFFRPSFWPNTPDILTEQLQSGGRPAAMARLVLAATLSASYGIYGPPFELGEHAARERGSEEYLDSEKYQLRTWNLDDPWSLRDLIGRVNTIRRTCPALQQNRNTAFHRTTNPAFCAYSKHTDNRGDVVLCVVNTDPHARQAGETDLDMPALGLGWGDEFEVEDLLTGAVYTWRGPRNFVALEPGQSHILHLRTGQAPTADDGLTH
ncbi:MAG: alpha-1,4-glucan--maltose-1-phosphate maltosyltransferase [Phycisphaerales bacterium JB039]